MTLAYTECDLGYAWLIMAVTTLVSSLPLILLSGNVPMSASSSLSLAGGLEALH